MIYCCLTFQPAAGYHVAGYIGLENFCSIVAPWTDKTPVEKRATRADYEDALAEVPKPWFIGIGHVIPNPYVGLGGFLHDWLFV